MPETVKQRLLRQAERLAGVDAVSQGLRAEPHVIQLWIRGLAPMPDRKLLSLADLLDKIASERERDREP
jgi:hypothetical protein